MSEERARPAGFTDVLTTWGGWDRPRSGVTMIEGVPHRFVCEFDDTLDDYPGRVPALADLRQGPRR